MVAITTISFITALFGSITALPGHQDAPGVVEKRDNDTTVVPSSILPSLVLPAPTAEVVEASAARATGDDTDDESDDEDDDSDEDSDIDDDDLETGGPDPSPCATALCLVGDICEVVDGEALCRPPDEEGLLRCGPNSCEPGQVCCNPSCGICTPPDGACITLFCGDNERS